MLAVVTEFYNVLLSAEAPSAHRDACRDQVWAQLTDMLTEVRVRLMPPISEEELQEALSALLRSSCPGEDGLTPAFFAEY